MYRTSISVATKLGSPVSRNTKLDEIFLQFREISRNFAKFCKTDLDEISRNFAKFCEISS
jgi:hypothetical protein